MPRIKKFTVIAKLPPALEPLRSLAYNLWWSWDPEAIDLFFRIDRDRWINVKQNPRRRCRGAGSSHTGIWRLERGIRGSSVPPGQQLA